MASSLAAACGGSDVIVPARAQPFSSRCSHSSPSAIAIAQGRRTLPDACRRTSFWGSRDSFETKKSPNTKIPNFGRHAARLTVARAEGDGAAETGGTGAGGAGRAASGAAASSDSFLGMWKRAQEKEREAVREAEARKRAEEQGAAAQAQGQPQAQQQGQEKQAEKSVDELKQLEAQFLQILEVPKEVRQEAERKAVVDRAAAALAAARALLVETEERARKERQASRGRRLAGAGDAGATSSVWGGKSLSVVKEKGGKKGGEGKGGAGGAPVAAAPVSGTGAAATTAAAAGGAGGGGGGLGGLWKAIPSRAKKTSPSSSSSSSSASVEAVATPTAKPAPAAKQQSSGASSGASSSPGPSFWEWAPPSESTPARGAAASPPKLQPAAPKPAQRATVTIADPQPQLLEALLLPFESAVAPTKPANAGDAGGSAGGIGGAGGAGGAGAGGAGASAASPTSVASAAALDLASSFLNLPSSSSSSDLGLPPLQSALEAQRGIKEALQAVFASDAAEPAVDGATVAADGSRWWKETGTEVREGGEVCDWTVVRGVSADGKVEWEEKWWEASDEFDFKELGAEKSGRDANGGVWRETWREATWQDSKTGLMHIEKTADKWGQNGQGGAWHEKWWEHYDATGRAEKWADKWSKIDMYTPLDDGHAHAWHERWGEEYDGRGAASKWCDKWAERFQGHDGYGQEQWTKWGDKWDEKFNRDKTGFRQGETWWQGAGGDDAPRWNKVWSEGHDGSGWVHKKGGASSGEGWDVREWMDTWFDAFPHFGFKHCLENSRRLMEVGRRQARKKQM
ncbi:hypothetical protein CLOM_g7263 [Closterium sp. NIES-68]|nr:hypothetical protein CLOM_g7263 [Closterium sp. NIES-68]GJP75963.1 hypothetical protein CLOP_g6361 [Closterium sp. NIES-67]